jgi:hypothetical protein
MNMTAAFLMAKKEAVEPVVGNQYRIVFNKRPSGFVNGSIYTILSIENGYVKLKGYKLTFLLSSVNFYEL